MKRKSIRKTKGSWTHERSKLSMDDEMALHTYSVCVVLVGFTKCVFVRDLNIFSFI